ncbi:MULTISPECIES: cyanate transporter [Pseudomonas]|jgi:CP family cyanate transporter-like MFS transporter|uniref:CP family cyanate transporter-like MFS transporter n=2 Tax=Pseudomonas TaxID=286 RepID=A0A9X8HJD3_PSEPU|nr:MULTISPECIES: cyanate transporter [Pseudomonas]MBG8561150.1 cyanate transporter [Pseudomonas qingdaonensis]MCP8348350.1 MFS transporter [Pseudomonas sp. FBF18]MCS5516702.1 cyanate transporter [Pseudomonas qingdaonensis]PPS62228.1 MFS transporter [Pseudomonas sp. BRM28]QVL21088.1 cyanate transporter [Pseudomonas qingdaonensis]
MREQARSTLLLLLVVVMALNLRPILTSIGPLLEAIRQSTGIGYQQAALLTALPVLCMGLVPLLQPWLRRWVSEQGAMLAGLAAIALACAWRLTLDSAAALIASAALAGLGVACIQALMPGLVNRWFPHRLAMAMGVYSAALMSGGGAAAVLGPRVAEQFSHWQAGLGIWLLPALLAFAVWAWVRPQLEAAVGGAGASGHLFGSRRAWLLAVYFGLINGGYTSMVAWLPAYYQQVGGSAQGGGELVGLMTVFQVAGALGLPLLLRRLVDRRPGLWLALTVQLAGFVGLLLAPAIAGLWVALIGFGLGACFSLSLTLTLEHLKAPASAGALAAFVQGVGFIITGIVPYVTGWLRDVSGDFQASWLLLSVTVLLMLLVTWRFAPSGYAQAMGMPLIRESDARAGMAPH